MIELNDEAFPVGETIEHERRRPISENDGRNCREPTTVEWPSHLGTVFATDIGSGRAVRSLTREQAAAAGDEAGS
ncbi:hypothetical protein [Natrinema pallidum]|uniref:Uncharacterized protein n=1 Tax=Natrinema pallidum DSM 3751 TaxID=1227495 RepID=L9YW66_9EURY|nr:hypothetical protein [Natrinema pallidum]ELY78374.1 hypothetical protein C487_08909 [Natrinema pallidum DSM 3751]